MYKTTSLILYQNQMSGTIPTEIGWLTQLTALGLMSNQLTGTIPCTIPTEMGLLTQLTYLNSHNDTPFTGTIPLALCPIVDATQ